MQTGMSVATPPIDLLRVSNFCASFMFLLPWLFKCYVFFGHNWEFHFFHVAYLFQDHIYLSTLYNSHVIFHYHTGEITIKQHFLLYILIYIINNFSVLETIVK